MPRSSVVRSPPDLGREPNGISPNSFREQGTVRARSSLTDNGVRGWQVETASTGWEALERVHAGPGPDLVLLDLIADHSEGMHTLRWLRRVRPDLPVLVLASPDDSNLKMEAIRLGAQDFLIRPLQADQLETAVRRSFFHYTESNESEILTDEIEQIGDDMFFVAASPTMRKLRAQAELLAQVNASVLILGEHGCGKELAARLIHKLSVRSGFRFLKVNCATLARRRAGE